MFALATAAMLFALPFYGAEIVREGFRVPSPGGWALIAYTAIFPSMISQLFFIRGVAMIGANRAGVFINLVPIFAALLAVLILGEVFQLYHLAGLVLVLGGLALAERFGGHRRA